MGIFEAHKAKLMLASIKDTNETPFGVIQMAFHSELQHSIFAAITPQAIIPVDAIIRVGTYYLASAHIFMYAPARICA